jgi:cytoskeletal protein RodZ
MSADRAPGGFGATLRNAREGRGVSLRQIANATKISVAALEALERNDISRLPGGIFSRAFVRSYAIEVGLDPDATIAEFVAQFPNDSVTAGHPTSEQVEDNVAHESDRRMAGTFLWLFLTSIPVAGVVLYFATSGRRVEPPAAPPAVATPAPGRDRGFTPIRR